MAATFTVTASTSRRGWRGWRRRAVSASQVRSATTSATASLTPSRTWASRTSRTSRGRYGFMRFFPKPLAARQQHRSYPPLQALLLSPRRAYRLSSFPLPTSATTRSAILRRWDHRGCDDRSVADREYVCDLAKYRVHVPEQAH